MTAAGDLRRLRVGSGFDLHPLSVDPGRKFLLAGVEVAASNGPVGHSDADAVCHAIADAILGAAGMGGIGDHFPASDPTLAGADSVELLAKCVGMAERAGFEVINVDSTVILQAPRLTPFRAAMESRMSEVVGAPVCVKAKSPEGVGPLGEEQAVVCTAAALLLAPRL